MLLVAATDDELERKVRAEVTNLGLDVNRIVEEPRLDDATLVNRHRAVALIRIVSERLVRIYVHDGDSAPHEMTLERAEDDGQSFAIRIVEHVRARLVELRVLAPEPSAATDHEAAKPHETAPSTAPTASRGLDAGETLKDRGTALGTQPAQPVKLWLLVGLGGSAPLGGMGEAAHVALGARVEPWQRWAFSVQALLAASENDLNRPEGEADALINLFIASAGYSPFLFDAWRLDAGAGAGLLVLPLQAEAEPPLRGHDDRLWSGVYFAHTGAAWSPASWFRLRTSLLGGVSLPRPVVRFDGHRVAAWGPLFGAGMITAEVGWALSTQEAAP